MKNFKPLQKNFLFDLLQITPSSIQLSKPSTIKSHTSPLAGSFNLTTTIIIYISTQNTQYSLVMTEMIFKAGSHVVPSPKSQVPSHLKSLHAISTVESMEFTTSHRDLNPKYDMDANMTTLFESETWDLC
jgi:hypothetical protein